MGYLLFTDICVDIRDTWNRDADISAVAFHPIRCMAVSSSFGGDFKVISEIDFFKYIFLPLNCMFCLLILQIWVSNHGIQNKDQMPQSSGWTCYAVGSYKYSSSPIPLITFISDIT